MLEGHISKAYDGALAAAHLRLLEMGGLVLQQVRDAGSAYTRWDAHLAQRIILGERAVSEYDVSIAAQLRSLIARRQPVASDLRALMAFSHASAELDLAAAEARKIARTVLQELDPPSRGTTADVRHLAGLAANLLRHALEALDHIDGEAAGGVLASERELDAEYAAGLRRLVTRALDASQRLDGAIATAFALKSFENIGEHARRLAGYVRAIVNFDDASDGDRLVVAASTDPSPAATQPPAAADPGRL
ncbi:MAG TPA: PhoU domain-containing protein [Steroidobacteraceae bacterium]|nr:PhoU domain-containing protein [Steroidobacteraceae bacterium]